MSESQTESDPVAGAAAAQDAPRPRRIAAAALLTGLQGLVVAVFGVVSLVTPFFSAEDHVTESTTLAVTVLALSALPLAAAKGLWGLRRWSRGPSMIVQLLALPVAWTMGQNGGLLTAGAVLLAVVAVGVLACLVNPTATQALGIGPRDPAGNAQ